MIDLEAGLFAKWIITDVDRNLESGNILTMKVYPTVVEIMGRKRVKEVGELAAGWDGEW